MDARIKSGHDECVSRDEVEDRFKHTNFTFQTAKTIQTRIHDLAAPCARGVDESPALRGRGERRMPVAPAASCALVVIERTRVTTSTPESPGVPARNGFNGFLRALPGDRALLPPSSADMSCLSPVGPTRLRKLDASVEASGPHDFAVRELHLSSARLVIAHRSFANPPCDPVARKTLPRPPHPHPASVTIAIRPSGGVGWREFVEMICPTGEAKYFCKGDSTQNCLTGKSPAGANGSRECAPDDKLSEKAEPSHANRERAHGGYRGPARSRIAARRTQGQRTVQIAWCAGPAHRDLGRL